VLELDHRINRDAVKAELTQGVLTLTLPKAESVKPRRIEIKG
jgi:HSP20 family protein